MPPAPPGPEDGTEVEIPAADGYPLAATLFPAQEGPGGGAVVLVNPATAVRRRFYQKYAGFLASRGFHALTYDPRGIGGSRPGSLSGFPSTMRDWGEQDLPGVLDWLAARYPHAPILLVGHSSGVQLLGLAPNVGRVRAVLAIASSVGDYRLWESPRRQFMALLMHAVIPGLTSLFGYLPGRLGLGEDVPRGIILQWARWCRTPGYLFADLDEAGLDRYRTLEFPILAYSFTDDSYAPFRPVEALLERFRDAPWEHRHLDPRDLGLRKVGHFGFFRSASRQALWEPTTDWLVGRVSPAEP